VQQFAVKIPINSDNFPIINFPVGDALQHECCHLRSQHLKIIDDLFAEVNKVE
jgi:hypothetical protein